MRVACSKSTGRKAPRPFLASWAACWQRYDYLQVRN
jgi:hypothetical protein